MHASRVSFVLGLGLAGVAFASAGCGGPDPIAFDNRTFFDNAGRGGAALRNTPEVAYPPLDLSARGYQGVSVVQNLARLSRPSDWVVRRSSVVPGARSIEYVSPRQFLFTLHERPDPPEALWADVLGRYEQDAKASGAELIGLRVPSATANAQGRSYVVKRSVNAATAPFVNTSREMLLRGESHVVLVQIVHGTSDLVALSEELLRVIATMEVL